MIYPTEMTVATGTTAYAGDPASDERIVSREVRVSVTYQIEDEEVDLADLAYAKAAEVERARLAAQEKIAACERIERNRIGPSDLAFDPNDTALEPPDDDPEQKDGGEEDYGEGDSPDPFPPGKDCPGARCGHNHGAIRVVNGHSQDGGHAGNGAPAVSRSAPPWVPPAETSKASETDKASEEETDWATRPQVLALGSHFRRLGVGPADQTALLRARFGKFRPERLTKEEAAQLMRYLERGELEPERGEREPAVPVATAH